MNLRIFVVIVLFAAVWLSVLSVPYANSQSSAVTTTMSFMQPASGRCTVRSLAFLAVKGDEIAGTYGSDAEVNFYIVAQNESNSIQDCHLPANAKPLLIEENAIGQDNPCRSLPFPANGSYCFLFIYASGPTGIPSGYATVELSFPASTILINSTVSPSRSTTSLSSAISRSGTKNFSSTTASTIILPTAVTSGPPSVTSQASAGPTFRNFGTVAAIASAVVIVLLGAVVLFMRRKKTPQSTITVEEKPSPKAEPLERAPQPAASGLSTGYGELDRLLDGGLPKGYAVLLLSPRCDERDLLLGKIVASALSVGTPTFFLSNDLSKIQNMAITYGENFYALTPQAAKTSVSPGNLYEVPVIDSLSDLNMTFKRILGARVRQGMGNRLLIVDLLTYSRIFLVDKGGTAKKWFSDFLTTRKAEGFTVLGFLNPRVASNKETQTLTDVFDGIIEIYEKELGGVLRRFLVVKRMYGHSYSNSELMLDKGKLF